MPTASLLRGHTVITKLLIILPLLLFNGPILAQAPETYYPFTIPWDHQGVAPFNQLDEVAPAGSKGHVRNIQGQLVFADGSPARFWGIGIAVAPDFPPKSRIEAQLVAKKLRAYGVNFVRFTGLDYKRVGLFSSWQRTGMLDRTVMDRLDYFIAKLREQGIYYSLTIHDSSEKASLLKDVSPNNNKVSHKQYKFVQIFDETVERVILDWYGAFYDHLNPHTKLKYALDPANIFVSAVNEDSVINGYLRKKGANLSKQNYRSLESRFNKFLAQKYNNTSELNKSWAKGKKSGLSSSERIENASVQLTPAKKLKTVNPSRVADIFQFINGLNKDYATSIEKRLRSMGYQGLFTFTNDFYGFENIRLINSISGIVDMHGYFDHPIKEGSKAKGSRTESVTNIQMLAAPRGRNEKNIKPFDRNFYKFYLSAIEDLPFVISEWNHNGWSDYAYEGPLLMAAYGSLQGYDALAAHTYLSWDLNFKKPYISKGLAVAGNPVSMSLFPSLSLAWRKGYISPAITELPLSVAKNTRQLQRMDSSAYAKRPLYLNGNSLHQGFTHKLRVRPLDPQQSERPKVKVSSEQWRSDTGEINWSFGTAEKTRLTINAPKFKAAAGQLNTYPAQLGSLGFALRDHGAVTAVSLDDVSLDVSGSILITVVSSFRNTDERRVTRKIKGQKVITIEYPGQSPVLMRRVNGTLTIKQLGRGNATLMAIDINGDLTEVKSMGVSADTSEQSFALGDTNSPWYWLRFPSKTNADHIGASTPARPL